MLYTSKLLWKPLLETWSDVRITFSIRCACVTQESTGAGEKSRRDRLGRADLTYIVATKYTHYSRDREYIVQSMCVINIQYGPACSPRRWY